MEDKNIEKKIELQVLVQYVTQLQQQTSNLNAQINELQELEAALTEINLATKKNPMFASLGSGIFLESELKDNNEVLVNVGQNIIVKKSVPEAKKLIKDQVEQLKLVEKQLESELNNYLALGRALEEELSSLEKQ
jgi:prefoldin alpha subunit